MTDLDLTTRAEAGAALTSTQHDTNLTDIQTKVNAIIAKLALIAADDGTATASLIDAASQIANSIITLAKMAALTGSEGKWLRANASTAALEAAQIYSGKVTDSTAKHPTGAQTAFALSSHLFEDTPAGVVMVWGVVFAQRQAGSNGGTINVKVGATVVAQVPTHILDAGTTQWMALPYFGQYTHAAAGDLTLALTFETSEVTSDVVFGVDGDGRFARSAMILAGL